MLETHDKLHPKSKSITQLKEALQVIWDNLPHEPINKAVKSFTSSHRDWRDAQKLTLNNSSTQSDCETSDIVVKYRHLKSKQCVVSVTLFCYVSAQFF